MSSKTAVKEEQKTQNEKIEQFNKIMFYAAPAVGFVIAFALAFTPVWHLAILAGIIAGAFYNKMKQGVVAGLIGVGFGWTLYVIIKISTSNIEALLNQVGGIILGSSGMGWLFIIAVIILGFAFGALGGTLGSGIRKLICLQKETKQNE
ncbi:MAG: hypothetical protein KAS22_00955 [Candidatus Heimdallarchaeota archaeon]|nr:hypothetical protein [Candidatus Heimdallarchaeota archaeon]MCK5183923.1 hypothetical protein [Candidatus Heimdallarchaeota archaeon]